MTTNQKKRWIFLYSSIISGVAGLLIKLFYRPWVNHHPVNDFGWSGVAPNFLFSLGICLFIAFVTTKRTLEKMIFATCGILLYETEQLWTYRTFDFGDIAATLSGLGLAILIYKRAGIKDKPLTENEKE
ncbi:MAG: hypothetical protein V2I54_13295 [Bacteroidales bacterium]|jgi:hypothetical protein|nr:hypothetical protein [Bacteroidales bacterium]